MKVVVNKPMNFIDWVIYTALFIGIFAVNNIYITYLFSAIAIIICIVDFETGD